MDLLSKTHVGIRSSARATIYKAALQPYIKAVFGIIIGTHERWTSPIFEAALVSCSCDATNDFSRVPKALSSDLALYAEFVNLPMAKPIAIFAAWENLLGRDRNQCTGQLVDTASELKLPYLAIFPTDGGETIWGVSIYFANRFPHDPLPYSMLKKCSDRPEHNPRRVKAMWKKIKCEHGNA
jgi:hypothetical protein